MKTPSMFLRLWCLVMAIPLEAAATERIVCLGASITETVFALFILGMGERYFVFIASLVSKRAEFSLDSIPII